MVRVRRAGGTEGVESAIAQHSCGALIEARLSHIFMRNAEQTKAAEHEPCCYLTSKQASWRRNRRASGPRSPTFPMLHTRLHISGVTLPLPPKQHVNPPIPLFKIPPAQWPSVLQQVAQGESLRQIARSYHTSYEAVCRVLSAARKELLVGEGAPSLLPPEDPEEAIPLP